MKNPLEFTLLEVEALCLHDPDCWQAQEAMTVLLRYIQQRQVIMLEYERLALEKRIKEQHAEITRRRKESWERDLLDHCEVVDFESKSQGA